MNGLPGIGVLISVLWLFGAPIYLMVDTNNTAKVIYESCIRSADLAFEPGGFEGDNPGELKTADRRCARSFENMRLSPTKLMRLLLGREGGEARVDDYLGADRPFMACRRRYLCYRPLDTTHVCKLRKYVNQLRRPFWWLKQASRVASTTYCEGLSALNLRIRLGG
jgi:hypothetical protein